MRLLLPTFGFYAALWLALAALTSWIQPTGAATLPSGSIPYAILMAGAFHLASVWIVALCRHRPHKTLPPAFGRTDQLLIAFSAVFLASSVAAGVIVRSDYAAHLDMWKAVVEGRDPWLRKGDAINAYGPLFNALAFSAWINPLLNKLLLAFAYLVFVIWLMRDFGARRGLNSSLWPAAAFWLINPFPWVEIAYFGHFDVLVALASVAAVHWRRQGRDVAAGISLALGILLKFLPAVVLPFLVLDRARLRMRLLVSCTALVAVGLIVSTVLWGGTFVSPLSFAVQRGSRASIYGLLARLPGYLDPVRFGDAPNLDWLALPFLAAGGLAVFAWCVVRRVEPALAAIMAILVTLQFYQMGYINYQMVPFFLISYWAVSEWEHLSRQRFMSGLLICHFSVIATLDVVILRDFSRYSTYGGAFVALKSVTAFAILAALVWFSAGQERVTPRLHGSAT